MKNSKLQRVFQCFFFTRPVTDGIRRLKWPKALI